MFRYARKVNLNLENPSLEYQTYTHRTRIEITSQQQIGRFYGP